MPDRVFRQDELLTPEQLKSKVDDYLFRIRNSEGAEYYSIFKELWVSSHEVGIWLDQGEEYRRDRYDAILNSPPADHDWQKTKIIQLVMFSLTDDELRKILNLGLPEHKARESGFEDLADRKRVIEDVLTQHLELCKYYDSTIWLSISWKKFVNDICGGRILPIRPVVEAGGNFSNESKEYLRRELSDYELEDLQMLKEALKLAEQRLLEHTYIGEVDATEPSDMFMNIYYKSSKGVRSFELNGDRHWIASYPSGKRNRVNTTIHSLNGVNTVISFDLDTDNVEATRDGILVEEEQLVELLRLININLRPENLQVSVES